MGELMHKSTVLVSEVFVFLTCLRLSSCSVPFYSFSHSSLVNILSKRVYSRVVYSISSRLSRVLVLTWWYIVGEY
jgi:hypothetical protein